MGDFGFWQHPVKSDSGSKKEHETPFIMMVRGTMSAAFSLHLASDSFLSSASIAWLISGIRFLVKRNDRRLGMAESTNSLSGNLELRRTVRIRTGNQCIGGHPIVRMSDSLLSC